MKADRMACLGADCLKTQLQYFETPEDEKRAQLRNKHINKLLKEHHRSELKRLKILMLGTGESGKSTITKQMKIIHINGFDEQERQEKINDIKKNIRESIVVILCAMNHLNIPLELPENRSRRDTILNDAGDLDSEISDSFLEETEMLWKDKGVQECFLRSYEYQLIDSAKYFLDKISEIRHPDYIPSDQDILRCRVLTTSIQHIQFEVLDNGNQVSFSVFDVGGQRGERRKWIQVFDSVVAILFLADCSSYDQNLREDRSKNRFLEALEIFEQVWRNRFLKNVSVLLFMNKMDILAEKVHRGRYINELTDKYPKIFPNYEEFNPSNAEKIEFIDAYNKPPEGDSKKRRGSRSSSKSADVNPDLVKTAVYIKRLFMKIVNGEIELVPTVEEKPKDWHQNHTCEYFYTCAVDTSNIQRVLKGCRTIIIRKHLERFGII